MFSFACNIPPTCIGQNNPSATIIPSYRNDSITLFTYYISPSCKRQSSPSATSPHHTGTTRSPRSLTTSCRPVIAKATRMLASCHPPATTNSPRLPASSEQPATTEQPATNESLAAPLRSSSSSLVSSTKLLTSTAPSLGNHDQYFSRVRSEYLAILLYTHYIGFSMKNLSPCKRQKGDGLSTNSLSASSITTCWRTPTGQCDDELFACNLQRDSSVLLGEFERKAYLMSSRVYLCPIYPICTLDDDLMGTWLHENPVKTISSRRADKEGHAMSAVADAFFRAFLHSRFGRWGETRSTAEKLLADMLEICGEGCLEGIVLKVCMRAHGHRTCS